MVYYTIKSLWNLRYYREFISFTLFLYILKFYYLINSSSIHFNMACEYEAPEDLDEQQPPPEHIVKRGLVALVGGDSLLQLPPKTSDNILQMVETKLGVGNGVCRLKYTTEGEVIYLSIGGVSRRNLRLDELHVVYSKLSEIFKSIQPGMEYEDEITCCYRFVKGKLSVKHGINGCFGRDRLHGYEAVPEDDDSLVQEVLVPGLKNY